MSETPQMALPIAPPKRPLLRYHGGKWILAPWIISHFPPHQIYCEPFCGAASILLRKPRARVEIINDLDDDVVNLFQVLRDPARAAALARALELTPFARAEFIAAYRPTTEPLERARRLIARSYMGFGSHSHNLRNSNGFRAWTGLGKHCSVEFANYPASLPAVVSRLRGVLIEHRPALQVIPAHDGADTLFLIDPPYPLSTRCCNQKGYVHEMHDEDHRALALHLRAARGKVILCGYPCELYDRELYPDWRRVTRAHYAGGQTGKTARTEVLWLNF